jgi:hypothetical protein
MYVGYKNRYEEMNESIMWANAELLHVKAGAKTET